MAPAQSQKIASWNELRPKVLTMKLTIFRKIFLIIICTSLIAIISVWLYDRYALRNIYSDFIKEQSYSYTRLITSTAQLNNENSLFPNDILIDTTALRSITLAHPVDIRIEKPEGKMSKIIWTSTQTLPSAEEVITSSEDIFNTFSNTTFTNSDSISVRNVKDNLYSIHYNKGNIYLIHFRTQLSHFPLLPVTFLIEMILLLLIATVYKIVKLILRPLNSLMTGVQMVGSGEFDYQVPLQSNDELGELTKAFNAMSNRVNLIMQSKRRLLFDVSHELRTPLTRMSLTLTMMPESKQRERLQRNVKELNIMITELLENERLMVLGGKLILEEVNLVSMIHEICEGFNEVSNNVLFDSLSSELFASVDTQRVSIAIKNIISNAIKYSGKDHKIDVRLFPDEEGVRIVVADRGMGIPIELQKEVFEPFYRVDDSRTRSTGGYGLGLPLAKAIVDAHNGTIDLTSTQGVGTTVTIWLPNSSDNVKDIIGLSKPDLKVENVKTKFSGIKINLKN